MNLEYISLVALLSYNLLLNMQPAASRESFVPGNDNVRMNGSANHLGEMDVEKSTQDKRSRKTSTVLPNLLIQNGFKS